MATPPCLIIAGTHSGVGKTTVALALMAALRLRGQVVQPFKVGPDFIDPGHHAVVCGRTSRNLDTWMLPDDEVLRIVSGAADGADIVVIEGAMGLFDGRGDERRGSTADVARLLDAPVVLVVDAAGLAGSIAAVVHGFATFDPRVTVAGVICNRVAGPRHYEYLETPLRRHTAAEPLGWLPRQADWRIPERHLGLTTAEDLAAEPGRWETLGRAFAATVTVDVLLALGRPVPAAPPKTSIESLPPRVRRTVAVARDAAFCFYYADNLDRLEAAGGRLAPFSPLSDEALPPDTDVLYLGGGYPELHAARLAANEPLRRSIHAFHERGGVIYAECGGLMALCRELVDAAGTAYPMFDLLPARTVMQPRRAALGYLTLRTDRPTRLGPAGTAARGHEFHYSRLEPLGPLTYAAEADTGREPPHADGIVAANLWAAYAHLHFGSCLELAAALLAGSDSEVTARG
jgi:cobyrinic acid a,c-diamide synthase